MSVAAGCGVGERASAPATAEPSSAIGAVGEYAQAPYVAYERVDFTRLPRERLEADGELRFAREARRVPAYRLKDGDSAIRYSENGTAGWLAWQPEVALRARQALAKEEGRAQTDVTVLSVVRTVWPDGCLGIARPASGCARESTAGFRVTLRSGSRTAVYHTDLTARVERAAG